MNWNLALERNRDALAAIILALGAMLRAGIIGEGRITKILRKAILRILTPAESAVRRLIVIAAQGLKGPFSIGGWSLHWPGESRRREDAITRLTFPLFERSKRALPPPPAPKSIPRIRGFGDALCNPRLAVLVKELAEPLPPPPLPDPSIDARRLYWRLEAVKNALADIPGQARRLVRLRALRAAAKKPDKPLLSAGNPPGHRKKRTHPIDDILAECQYFVGQALSDTS